MSVPGSTLALNESMTIPDQQLREDFWRSHYDALGKSGTSWLDYSNDRVQAQSFGLVFEAADGVTDRRCLDLGCGMGQLCRAVSAFGAKSVLGVDVSSAIIARNAEAWPGIQWVVGSVSDSASYASEGPFDRVFAIEVLQYIDVVPAIESMWQHVAPGGRLIAVVPNGQCPIVEQASQRFEGHYVAPAGDELVQVLSALPEASAWGIRGMSFQENQEIAPYGVSEWTQSPTFSEPPNRWQFVVQRQLECEPS